MDNEWGLMVVGMANIVRGMIQMSLIMVFGGVFGGCWVGLVVGTTTDLKIFLKYYTYVVTISACPWLF